MLIKPNGAGYRPEIEDVWDSEKPVFEIEECTFETDTLKKQLEVNPYKFVSFSLDTQKKDDTKPDWTFLYVFIIGLAIGILFTHEYIIKCVDILK